MLKKPASVVLDSSKSSTYLPRVRLRVRFACGLADSLFDHPEISHTTARLTKMHTMYCVRLGFPAARKGVRIAVDKANDGETSRGEDESRGGDASPLKILHKARQQIDSQRSPLPCLSSHGPTTRTRTGKHK